MPGSDEFGISGAVKLRLTDQSHDKNYKVYFDNWFTSIDLVNELKLRGIYSVGTIRQNRLFGCHLKTEKTLKKEKRSSYSYVLEANSNIQVVRWYDNRAVTLISSYLPVPPEDEARRYDRKEKEFVNIVRPNVVREYNKFMGGVDLSDMLIELYRIDMPLKKWYMRIIFYLIDMSVSNSWLVYRRSNPEYMPLRDLKLRIAAA